MGKTDTEELIQNHLELLAGRFQFGFYLVNMAEIENRLNRGDHELLAVLSNAELQYWADLKLPKHKIQWISGRYAVKSALFKYKSQDKWFMDVSCVDVLKGPDSAPYLPQYPGLHVSISHSYPYCIGVVTERGIGIDIEAVFNPPDSLIRYFYHPNEQEQLGKYGEPMGRAIQSMIYWTRKEAVSKLLGLGMKLDFKGLDTTQNEIGMPGLPDKIIHLASWAGYDYCLSTAVLSSASAITA